jgi:hypothetical protein
LYDNNSTDIQTLLGASSTATPILGASPLFYANFTVPSGSNGDYLYLIWDLRDSILTQLCFSRSLTEPCCDCELDNYYLNDVFADSTSIFTDANMTTFAPNGFYSTEGIVRELVDGVLLPAQICTPCVGPEAGLRSEFGVVDPDAENVCTEILEIPIFIVTSVPGEITSGDIACNSNDPLDTFDGGGLYYRLSLNSDPFNSRVSLISSEGVINNYIICVTD